MRANVYIDGFNLYYGALKGTAFRWLNVATLCRLILPNDVIHQIKYFSAIVDPRPGHPAQRIRQQTFFRALNTIPNLSIILGSFLTHEITMPLAGPKGGFARVIKTEEKGSDVNIATHLLMDGFRNDYEIAIVVSNDSDLLLPIRVVTEQLGKPVGLLNPQKHPSTALLPYVRFVKQIRAGVLAKSQFPSTLKDQQGTFTKPPKW